MNQGKMIDNSINKFPNKVFYSLQFVAYSFWEPLAHAVKRTSKHSPNTSSGSASPRESFSGSTSRQVDLTRRELVRASTTSSSVSTIDLPGHFKPESEAGLELL